MKDNKQINGPVCYECGVSANVLTCLRQYGDRPKQIHYTVSTYSPGTCAFCKEEKEVTEQRDFFYPDFSLLARAKNGISLSKKQ